MPGRRMSTSFIRHIHKKKLCIRWTLIISMFVYLVNKSIYLLEDELKEYSVGRKITGTIMLTNSIIIYFVFFMMLIFFVLVAEKYNKMLDSKVNIWESRLIIYGFVTLNIAAGINSIICLILIYMHRVIWKTPCSTGFQVLRELQINSISGIQLYIGLFMIGSFSFLVSDSESE